jgi:hypothetical protein
MKGAQFINDDPVAGTGATGGKGGGHLHCARTDFGPESATFYQARSLGRRWACTPQGVGPQFGPTVRIC